MTPDRIGAGPVDWWIVAVVAVLTIGLLVVAVTTRGEER